MVISNVKKLFCNYLYELILGALLLFLVFDSTSGLGLKWGALLSVVSIILYIAFLYVIKKYKKEDFKIEKMYLYLIIIFGLLYLFLVPIGSVPDERNHFLRAYEISSGHLLSEKTKDNLVGRNLDSSLLSPFQDVNNSKYSHILNNINAKKTNKKEFLQYGNTALYSPVSYIPQVIGISIGRLFNFSPIVCAYLGRLLNLIFYILVTYLAIKFIPVLKRSLFLLLFTPMMMQEAASLSPDAIVNCCSIALIAYVLYSIKNKNKKFTNIDYALLVGFTIVLSLSKIVYLPMLLLLLLIPSTRFNSKKKKIVVISLLAVMAIILNLTWLKISSNYLIEFNAGVDSKAQVLYILKNPLRYMMVVFRTINANILTLVLTFGGSHLEWMNLYLSQPIILLYLLFIVITVLRENKSTEKLEYTTMEKILFIAVFIIIVALTFTSLYVQWTPVGNGFINGLQGRYFIPIILLPLLLVKNDNYKYTNKMMFNKFYYIPLFMNIYALIVIFSHHI